jgi:hypothetical protein
MAHAKGRPRRPLKYFIPLSTPHGSVTGVALKFRAKTSTLNGRRHGNPERSHPMKRIALTLSAALIATSAAAGSDRYHDNKFDTSVKASAQTTAPAPKATLSTKGKSTPYAYINPYGVGPHNDSR